MKKIIPCAMLFLSCFAVTAQSVLPNAGFENWTYSTNQQYPFWQPNQWGTVNPLSDPIDVFSTVRDSLIFHSGGYSAKLVTEPAIVQGVVGLITTGLIDSTTQSVYGGCPYTSMPSTFSGYYRFLPGVSDTLIVQVVLSYQNTARGTGYSQITGTTNGWAGFQVPINYGGYTGPIDTAQIVITSGNTIGSTVWIDDVSFSGLNTVSDTQIVCYNSNLILTPDTTGLVNPLTYSWQVGAGNQLSCNSCEYPSVTITQNSSYYITVTDANGVIKKDTLLYTVSTDTNALQLTAINYFNWNCADSTAVSIANGVGPYTVIWNDYNTYPYTVDSPSANYWYLTNGVYPINITDARGCVSSIWDTVNIQGTFVAFNFDSVVQPTCGNQNGGSISTQVTSGTPPYMYSWSYNQESNGLSDTTQYATGLQSGKYYVLITDSRNCRAFDSITISSYGQQQVYAFVTETDANCGINGSIIATGYAGTPPYNYLWSNSATTDTISGLSAGSYLLTVTDSSGCTANAQVIVNNNCFGSITGTVFFDANNNCIKDAGDSAAPYVAVVATDSAGNQYYGYTDQNGFYIIQIVNGGTYTLYAYSYSCGAIVFCGDTAQTVYLVNANDSSGGNNIAIDNFTGYDLTYGVGWTIADPGFQKQYIIVPTNISNTPYTGPFTVTFTYDTTLVYQGSSNYYQPVNDPVNHTLTWAEDTTLPNTYFNYSNYYFLSNFLVPSYTSLSYVLQSSIGITPTTSDCDTANNFWAFSDSLLGSVDPNEKTVSPANNILQDDSVLTYTIHFQNTGTDSTHFIIVKDTLSLYLNAATVRNVASSYKYSSFNINGKGILTWTFNPYRLPDSITNPLTSKGFITFTVNKKPNAPLGAVISNTAAIYFDYNNAVVTNTVTDTVASPTGIIVVNNASKVSVKTYPNPFNDLTNVVVTGLNQPYDFNLYDVTGRLLRSLSSINTSQFQLNRESLAAGVYVYRIAVSNTNATGLHQVAFGKIVVQ